MCIDALYHISTRKSFICLFVTPYESQVRLIFRRLNELIDESPYLKKKLIARTKNPFVIEFEGHSTIVGFTTGASSGRGGASIRGQRADRIYIDESDYMGDSDFDAVLMIAGERDDIYVTLSSTPTGARKKFYQCCTDKRMHFKEFYFPSMCNPNWGPRMEEEFRAQLSESGYIHEVLAEFGPQDTGVFNKECIDKALTYDLYSYASLTYSQQERAKNNEWVVDYWIPQKGEKPYKPNPFRTMGVDWDKVQASPSIVILDYDMKFKKFRVIQRYEVPKAEYTFDAAVQKIIEFNEIYQPSYIYVDRGSGEYQIETLHKYGDEHPESMLKTKLKAWQFANTIEVQDPGTGEIVKKPMKPFMVNQLAMALERNNLILSPFDETLHKQLVDYEILRVSSSGQPIYSDKNEHFVDCLGLAFLAFALEFPDIAKTTFKNEVVSAFEQSTAKIGLSRIKNALASASNFVKNNNPWDGSGVNGNMTYQDTLDDGGNGPHMFPCAPPRQTSNGGITFGSWGNRASGLSGGGFGRSPISRKMW